jgi:hypothetical protein
MTVAWLGIPHVAEVPRLLGLDWDYGSSREDSERERTPVVMKDNDENPASPT